MNACLLFLSVPSNHLTVLNLVMMSDELHLSFWPLHVQPKEAVYPNA